MTIVSLIISVCSFLMSVYAIQRAKRAAEQETQQRASSTLEEALNERLREMISRSPQEMLLKSELMNRHFAEKFKNIKGDK